MTLVPKDRSARTRIKIGSAIVIVTTLAQGTILLNNTAFTMQAFGWAFTTIFLAAAACYIAMPWIADHIDDIAHSGVTRAMLFAFCFWVTFEEHVHASHGFKSPEGVTAIASIFVPESDARLIATILAVGALLAIVEALHHLHCHGAWLIKSSLKSK